MHSIQQASLDKYFMFPLLTTAGEDSFSEKLKLWIVPVRQSQSSELAPSDPQLASQMLRIGGNAGHRTVTSRKPHTHNSIDISWFELTMQPVNGRLHPADIMPVIAGLTDMLKAGYFDEVDFLFKSFKVKDAPPEMMVALLRTAFPLRGKPLRQWSKLLKEVKTELEARQLDFKKILRGLV